MRNSAYLLAHVGTRKQFTWPRARVLEAPPARNSSDTALWEASAPLWSDGRALGECARHGHQGTSNGFWEGVIRYYRKPLGADS